MMEGSTVGFPGSTGRAGSRADFSAIDEIENGGTMLKIECRESHDVMVVDLVGRMRGGPDTRAIKEVIKSKVEGGHRKFVLNLAELEWMTSIGIGVLVESYASVRRVGGSMVILSPTERVSQTLEMTKLIPTLFRVFEDEDEATSFEAPVSAVDKETS